MERKREELKLPKSVTESSLTILFITITLSTSGFSYSI
jgi:hypothetical protein